MVLHSLSCLNFPSGPNLPGTATQAAFLQEVTNVTNYSATLNDARKMSSEYCIFSQFFSLKIQGQDLAEPLFGKELPSNLQEMQI